MSTDIFSIVHKLYQWSKDQLTQDILRFYNLNNYTIINYVYGYTIVNRKLLEPIAQQIRFNNTSIDFRQLLLDSSFLLPDGAAVRTMRTIGRLLNRRSGPKTIHNLNGTDFMPYFLDYLHKSDYKVNIITLTVYDPRINNPKGYLKNGALSYISKHRPKFTIHAEEVLYGDTDYDKFDRSGVEQFIHKNQTKGNSPKSPKTSAVTQSNQTINILLNFRGGSYGWPHQELFAFTNKDNLKRLWILCLNQGATVDFRTGKETRAPLWIRKLRLESVYRLFSDPQKNRNKFLQSFRMIGLIIRKIIFWNRKLFSWHTHTHH